jgi:hypothetical protein
VVAGAHPGPDAHFGGLDCDFAQRHGIAAVNRRIDDTNGRINDLRIDMNKRFDDAQDVWRVELRRVEEVIDARLQHLERE